MVVAHFPIEDGLKQVTNHVQDCRDQIRELTKSISTSLQDLRRAVQAHEKDLEKEQKRSAKEDTKKKAEAGRMAASTEAGHRQNLAKSEAARNTSKGRAEPPIFVEGSLGDVAANVLEIDMVRFQELLNFGRRTDDPPLDWDLPFVVRAGGTEFEQELQTPKLQGCVQQFRDLFRKDPVAAKTGRAKMAMQCNNGLEEVDAELGFVMPPPHIRLDIPEVSITPAWSAYTHPHGQKETSQLFCKRSLNASKFDLKSLLSKLSIPVRPRPKNAGENAPEGTHACLVLSTHVCLLMLLKVHSS